MVVEMRTLNITDAAFATFCTIKAGRKQDTSRAATFDHILYVYEVQKFREKAMKL